ncbi:MAG: hypothetical protein P8J87_00340, partial [Verrucomicrobiales bacterium]|nr:hypothetical protein [Verrucomicrobiales bacterium]
MPDSSPRHSLLATLVATLVAASSLGQLFAQDTPAPPPEQITFVGYNLKNWLPMDRRIDGDLVEDATKPEDEKAALIALLSTTKPDIVGICEIGSRSDVEDFQARLKAAGHDLPHLEWLQASDPYRHVAAISKFPVVATDHQGDLSYNIDDKTLPFSRGILDATIQVTADYQLRILGLHLKSKRDVPEAD